MKNIIILKWDSLVLSIVSVLYGSMLLIYPQILQGYRVYDLIDDIFDNYFIGTVFIILGCLKLLGIWINNKKLSILLSFYWQPSGLSFLFHFLSHRHQILCGLFLLEWLLLLSE